ncbi:MAG: hypothetical protein A2W22_04430 [Candidatus Levybacteria bacterium RBG_16_35_11]|nr:MAG: hypothetical protein A2W22_04430 [Candidatus Levybacteria bacterium RBG_16_35_11]
MNEVFLNPEIYGFYYFIKQIKGVDLSLIKQAVSIYDISLGQKYIPENNLIEYVNSQEKYVTLGAADQNRLFGVGVSFVASDIERSNYNKELNQFEKILDLNDYKVGIIKSIAVLPDFRHRGIGTSITMKSEQKLIQLGSNLLFAISWDSERPDSSKRMFEKLGYENVSTIKDYWTKDSTLKGYECPRCEKICHCQAIFFLKHVN